MYASKSVTTVKIDAARCAQADNKIATDVFGYNNRCKVCSQRDNFQITCCLS